MSLRDPNPSSAETSSQRCGQLKIIANEGWQIQISRDRENWSSRIGQKQNKITEIMWAVIRTPCTSWLTMAMHIIELFQNNKRFDGTRGEEQAATTPSFLERDFLGPPLQPPRRMDWKHNLVKDEDMLSYNIDTVFCITPHTILCSFHLMVTWVKLCSTCCILFGWIFLSGLCSVWIFVAQDLCWFGTLTLFCA